MQRASPPLSNITLAHLCRKRIFFWDWSLLSESVPAVSHISLNQRASALMRSHPKCVCVYEREREREREREKKKERASERARKRASEREIEIELQCVATCCSAFNVLQCVAVCCSVLQRVAVCCNVLQCVATCCSVLERGAMCCSVLQCVAPCCSVLTMCLDPLRILVPSVEPISCRSF